MCVCVFVCVLNCETTPHRHGPLSPAGDALELSGPEGDFAEARLRDCRELVMFAAGTGFTPMAALIHAAYSSHYMEQRCVGVCVCVCV